MSTEVAGRGGGMIPKKQTWKSKSKSKPKGPSAETVGLLLARSGGVCEICGRAEATEIHHRKYRSRGGGHNIENLLHVCGMGNASGCHGRCHSGEGEAHGWAVHAWQNPALVPVRRADGLLWFPTTGGGWVLCDDTTDF